LPAHPARRDERRLAEAHHTVALHGAEQAEREIEICARQQARVEHVFEPRVATLPMFSRRSATTAGCGTFTVRSRSLVFLT
jgi:hypothetical protein